MLKYILILMLIIGVSIDTFAAGMVKGFVYDNNTGEPLVGATIYIHEMERGVVSDKNGLFVITSIPDKGLRAEISFIGYETRIIRLDSEESVSVGLSTTLVETAEVVVTAANFVSQHENAVKIEAIGIEAIQASGSPSFAESLSSIPGVDVISRGNGIGKPVIRGLSNSNLLFLNNGVKLENYQFSEDHPYVIDETGIDRVEVIKGPASLLYGSDAVGGLINLLPEHPAAVGSTEGDIAFGGYSVSNGYTLNGGVKQSTTNLSWGLRGSLKSHRDYVDGSGRFVPNSRFAQQSTKAFLAHNNHIGFFKLSYDYSHLQPGITNSASVALVDENGYAPKVWFQNLTNHMLLSKNTVYLKNTKINANISWNKNHRVLNTNEENAVNMALNSLGGEVKVWLPTNANSDVILGFQGQRKANRNYDGEMRVLPDYNENALALMGLYQRRFFEKLSLQAGGRYDFNSLHIPLQEKAIHSHHEEEDHEEEEHPDEAEHAEQMHEQRYVFHNASVSAGATLELNHDLLLRANVATAFRPPNVAELTQDGVHGNRFEKGDTSLTSQRNYEADLSLHYHTKSFSADIAGFYNLIPGYIYLSPTDLYEDDLLLYRYVQHDARLFGAEASVKYQPVSWIEMNGQLSIIRGMLNGNSYLPFVPHDKIKAGVKLMQSEIGFLKQPYFSVNVNYAFKQNRPSQFETETPDWLVTSFALGTKVTFAGTDAFISFNVTNLFDEKYFDHLSTLKQVGYYNPGRSAALLLKWLF